MIFHGVAHELYAYQNETSQALWMLFPLINHHYFILDAEVNRLYQMKSLDADSSLFMVQPGGRVLKDPCSQGQGIMSYME